MLSSVAAGGSDEFRGFVSSESDLLEALNNVDLHDRRCVGIQCGCRDRILMRSERNGFAQIRTRTIACKRATWCKENLPFNNRTTTNTVPRRDSSDAPDGSLNKKMSMRFI
jgi:hypothetical protein